VGLTRAGAEVRVAVIAEWYPSPADPVHGIWAHRQAVAAGAAGAEIEVLLLRRPVPPLAVLRRARGGDRDALRIWFSGVRRDLRPWTLEGIPVTPVPWLGPPRPLSYGAWGHWMAPPLARALSRLARRWPFDLLHVHTLAPAGHAASSWARRHRVPLLLSAHGPDMTDVPARSAVGAAAVRVALTRADGVLANSDWARRRCLELGAAPDRVRVLHLGADLPDAPAASAAVRAGGAEAGAGPARPGPLRLITIAHLQARKHHRTVLDAIAAIAPARRPAWTVIGDGEERAALEARAERLGVRAAVAFCGQLDHPQALARLADADLFVMPGVEEPFGVAFIEAMAAGVPAVGGRGQGGPEDIAAAGPGMLLVTPGAPAELAALLERLDADRAALAELGAAARATVAAHFTWERCGEATVAAYADVLALTARPRASRRARR
jgi:teichuronic acid biosynthesis glycosyltransferase TuaC